MYQERPAGQTWHTRQLQFDWKKKKVKAIKLKNKVSHLTEQFDLFHVSESHFSCTLFLGVCNLLMVPKCVGERAAGPLLVDVRLLSPVLDERKTTLKSWSVNPQTNFTEVTHLNYDTEEKRDFISGLMMKRKKWRKWSNGLNQETDQRWLSAPLR